MQYSVEEFQPRALNGYQSETSSRPQSNSPLQEYIDQKPNSRPGEIARLINQMKSGDPDAGALLIDESLKVIRYSVRRLNAAIEGDEDELINEACAGILKNIHSADLTVASPITTIYAHAKWAILRGNGLLPRNISLPTNLISDFRRMHVAESSLEADGFSSEDEGYLELLAERVEQLKPDTPNPSYRAALIKNGRGIINAIPMDISGDPELEKRILPGELSDSNQLLDEVESAVSATTDFRRMAGPSRFQFGKARWEKCYTVAEFRVADFTLQAIADAMGVTRERIRQLETEFYRIMAQYMYSGIYPDHLAFSETVEETAERRHRVFSKIS